MSSVADQEAMITRLEEENARFRAALEFYAKGRPKSTYDHEVGQRDEFGCGCCAGTYVKQKDGDADLDYDKSVQGRTAREALGLPEKE